MRRVGAIWRAWFPKLILWLLLARAPFALAEEWSQAYISTLLDAAFAAIETAKDGKKLRHLPHHDHTGPFYIAFSGRLGPTSPQFSIEANYLTLV